MTAIDRDTLFQRVAKYIGTMHGEYYQDLYDKAMELMEREERDSGGFEEYVADLLTGHVVYHDEMH